VAKLKKANLAKVHQCWGLANSSRIGRLNRQKRFEIGKVEKREEGPENLNIQNLFRNEINLNGRK
jgi:hypothetical protein